MTEDLLNELLDSPDPAVFASKHKLACRSLPDYLQQLLDERGLRRLEVVRQAGINPTFPHSGIKSSWANATPRATSCCSWRLL